MKSFDRARLAKRAALVTLGFLGAVSGCIGGKNDDNAGPDASVTTPPDSGLTTRPDTSAGDPGVPDTGVEETSVPDASVADTSVPDAHDAGPADADASAQDAADGSTQDASDGGVDAADAAVDSGADASDAGAPTVAISGGGNTKITLANGVPLFISDAHTPWTFGTANPVTYQNLPPALIGAVGNDTVNNNTLVTFTLGATTTCYLLRQVNWSSVSLSGWTQIATASYYFAGYDNGAYGTAAIYSQTFAPGTYNWSTFSAMYACAGQ